MSGAWPARVAASWQRMRARPAISRRVVDMYVSASSSKVFSYIQTFRLSKLWEVYLAFCMCLLIN